MTSGENSNGDKVFIVEHLDPELEKWSALEYIAIAKECLEAGARFCLTSVPKGMVLPSEIRDAKGLHIEHDSVEQLYHDRKSTVCLLDPAADDELSPEDGARFEVFLFGGILGDDPPRDRTKELRKKGFPRRRLGPVQMTTDTAVRVTRIVVVDKVSLDDIPYIDNPEIKVDRHESTVMPFRYVKDSQGQPVMPEGMVDLIKADSERGFGDVL